MNSSDIARKRSILFSARIRFSPEIQPVKDTAIDKIIEQNLLVADCEEGLTIKEIENQGAVCFAGGTPAINRHDMEKSLERLLQNKRLAASGKLDHKKYRLSKQARDELWEVQRSTEARFSAIVNKLFKNAEAGSSSYVTPFLDCLCIIFSQLGETYVRLIKGEVGPDELLREPIVNRALKEIKGKYKFIKESLFEAAIFSFFRESDPDYDAIKWNMAQNHYIAKALGLDPTGHLLSKEVFGNSTFYLDTNVVIAALEPKARHHRSFKVLSQTCRHLQIDLNVCQISLDELRRVVENYREILPKVVNQVPDETAPKIRNVFFELYRSQLKLKGSVDFAEIFSSFENPMDSLSKSYDITLVDNPWFTEAEHQAEIEKLSQAIKKTKRSRAKSMRSASHDAMLLQWVQLERLQGDRNTWLVTLDTFLPGFLSEGKDVPARSLAITLDALLQWMSPISTHDHTEDEVMEIFSEAVKYQLLPQDSFFDLRDFLVFAEMEWSCRELPAEDVEHCIRYVKANAPNLNPTVPADREKIAREISKFFADPGRKYKQEIQKMEAQISSIEQNYQHRLEEIGEKIRERDNRIESLEKERIEVQEKQKKAALTRSALIRMSVVILAFFVYELLVVYLANQYGEGTNLFQKVKNSWPFLTLGCGMGAILLWFILGKERIRILGWPFTKLLKNG
jgi:hypothetical protein